MQIIISASNVTLITSLLPSLARRSRVCPHKREGSQGNQKALDEHSYLSSVIQYLTDANNLNSSWDPGVFLLSFPLFLSYKLHPTLSYFPPSKAVKKPSKIYFSLRSSKVKLGEQREDNACPKDIANQGADFVLPILYWVVLYFITC